MDEKGVIIDQGGHELRSELRVMQYGDLSDFDISTEIGEASALQIEDPNPDDIVVEGSEGGLAQEEAVRSSFLNAEVVQLHEVLQTPHTDMTVLGSGEEDALGIGFLHESGDSSLVRLEGVQVFLAGEEVEMNGAIVSTTEEVAEVLVKEDLSDLLVVALELIEVVD